MLIYPLSLLFVRTYAPEEQTPYSTKTWVLWQIRWKGWVSKRPSF